MAKIEIDYKEYFEKYIDDLIIKDPEYKEMYLKIRTDWVAKKFYSDGIKKGAELALKLINMG